MATIEERLTFLEHEQSELKDHNTELKKTQAELKKTIELQTIAIGALVNKAALERLNEKYDKLFDSLIAHDRLTNVRLSELSDQYIELDGKIVGLQTEMRQSFDAVNGRFETVATKDDLSAINSRFETVATKDDLNAINSRFDAVDTRFETVATKDDLDAINSRFDAVDTRFETVATKDDLNAINSRFDAVDTRFDQIMLLLTALMSKSDQEA